MYMLILNFTYPLRCLRVPPVEYHCFTPYGQETRLYVAQGHVYKILVNIQQQLTDLKSKFLGADTKKSDLCIKQVRG